MTFEEKIIKNRVGLLALAEELGNVSRACKILGYSRDTFYRYKELRDEGGVESLREQSRSGRPNFKNRMPDAVEQRIATMAVDQPTWGQTRVKNELLKEGISISTTGIRGVWLRLNLETTSKRLAALEEKSAKEGLILTEAQVAALETARQEKLAKGEIETEHPGYLGSQDTFYVGTLKGVGRIYQQTFVDTFSSVALAKLYTMKTALTAADMLNDKVVPFFEEQKVPLLRVLTDRGTEYCGSPETHEYQLLLALENIDHTKTKARHPQTNGICERFHKTILTEFYQVAFRKKLYRTLEELQCDLDDWIRHYNCERTHQGKNSQGRTPMQTFLDGKKLAEEKILNSLFQSNSKSYQLPENVISPTVAI
jgi:transposase InsO family protein